MREDGPFDRRLRRMRRERAAGRRGEADYLHRLAADDLVERLAFVRRDFARALDLGCGDSLLAAPLRARGIEIVSADPGLAFASAAAGVQCDEDRLPFADASFDLVVSVGTLDSVNDLPGALLLIRRVLKPDGLFLGAFAGAGSLPRLRSAMLAADAAQGGAQGGATPRIHPQIDVRAAGDLLARAGFVLPVADSHGIDIRFPNLPALVADLRAMGATNLLAERARAPIGRAGLAAAIADFAAHADADGKTAEHIEMLHVAGWAPPPVGGAKSAFKSGE